MGGGYGMSYSAAVRAPSTIRATPRVNAGWTIREKVQPSPAHLASVQSLEPEWRVATRSGGATRAGKGTGEVTPKPIPTCNRFSALQSAEDGVPVPSPSKVAAPVKSRGGKGIVLIGSSNVKRVSAPSRRRAKLEGGDLGVTSWCVPSGQVAQVTGAVRAAVAGTKCSSLRVVAHVDVNDACSRSVEDILSSFEDLNSEVARVRVSLGIDMKLSICSIVPRIDCGYRVWRNIARINSLLWEFCSDIGADFVDLRPTLGSCQVPLNRSGVHYTASTTRRVAHRLFEHCRYFLR